jgi:hypothetical protein
LYGRLSDAYAQEAGLGVLEIPNWHFKFAGCSIGQRHAVTICDRIKSEESQLITIRDEFRMCESVRSQIVISNLEANLRSQNVTSKRDINLLT